MSHSRATEIGIQVITDRVPTIHKDTKDVKRCREKNLEGPAFKESKSCTGEKTSSDPMPSIDHCYKLSLAAAYYVFFLLPT